MIQFVKFLIAFIALNYFSSKTNIKHMMHQAIDIGLVMQKVSQDGTISTEDKNAVVQEMEELSEAVITFLDELKLPE